MPFTSVGTVTQWSAERGWGVIESEDTPGGCFAHFSVILAEDDKLRVLTIGAVLSFNWEPAEQTGFRFRATSVGSGQAQVPGPGPSNAYSSSLTVANDADSSMTRPR